MSSKIQIFIAKVLILFSFILILSGFIISKLENNNLSPISKESFLNANDKISIDVSLPDYEDINKNKEEILSKTNKKLIVVDNLEKVKYRIEEKYKIKVLYGKDTVGYSVGGLTTTSLEVDEEILSALSDLELALEKLPKELFIEIYDGGIPLTVYLIKNYSNNIGVTGVTDSNNSRAYISIAMDYNFYDSFYHELFHYIERYITKTGGYFNTWDSLNPGGFSYGTIDNSLSYNRTYSENSFFVNNYAQSDAYEDRASTFEYMMADTKSSCLNNSKPVWRKAKYISDILDLYFESVSPNKEEYWERFL